MNTQKTFDISHFRTFALSYAVLLAGCASAPPAPTRVEIPIFTPCVKMEISKPAYEFDKLTATATDGEIILALARDWLRGRPYEEALLAIVEGCK